MISDQRTAEPTSLVPEAAPTRYGRRATVGVVDDDVSILRALRRLLQAAGFSVETGASFHQGRTLYTAFSGGLAFGFGGKR